jgi:hypothetical protein
MPPKKGKPKKQAAVKAVVADDDDEVFEEPVVEMRAKQKPGRKATPKRLEMEVTKTMVSPEKAAEFPATRDGEKYYVINSQSYRFCSYPSEADALEAVEKASFFANLDAVPICTILPFQNKSAAEVHIESMKKANRESMKASPVAKASESYTKRKFAIPDSKSKSKSIAKAPKIAYSSSSSTTPKNDDADNKFFTALKAATTQIEVFHLEMDASDFDVWGFTYKEKEKYYWSWKPQLVQSLMITEKEVPQFQDQGMTLEEMLLETHSCKVRANSRGSNIAARTAPGKGTSTGIDCTMIFGFIPSTDNEKTVLGFASKFLSAFQNEQLQTLYWGGMKATMNHAGIIQEAFPGTGKLWENLLKAADKMKYRKLHSLNEIFMDDTIQIIINSTYKYPEGSGSSSWANWVRKLAFGESGSDEES